MKFLPNWIMWSTRSYRRLRSTRDCFEAKLKAEENVSPPWAKPAMALVELVDTRLKKQDLDGAWFCLREAMRQEIPYLEGEPLKRREQVLLSESMKVDSTWRKSLIDELLKQAGETELRLTEAQKLLDDYFQIGSTWRKSAIEELLKQAGNTEKDRVQRLAEAQELLDNYFQIDSTWRKSAIEELLKQAGNTEKDRALRLAEAQKLLGDYFQIDSRWRKSAIEELLRQAGDTEKDRAQRLAEVQKFLDGYFQIESTWRKSAIDELLKQAGGTDKDRAERLAEAQSLLDDYSQTQFYKGGLLRDQLRNLVVISVSALVGLSILIALSGTQPSEWPTFDWKTLLLILIFGVLGASFSATLKISDQWGKSKIPQLAANNWVTVARIALGATPALAAYAFLESGMLKIGDGRLPMVLAISFAAGFSERLVLSVLKTLDRTRDSSDDRKSGDNKGGPKGPSQITQ